MNTVKARRYSRANEDAERRVIAGLLQDPRRLPELRGVNRAWFSLPEVRQVIETARGINRESLLAGKVRYGTRRGIERRVSDRLTQSTGDKKLDGKRASLLQAVITLLDDCAAMDAVGEHEFKEAVDEVNDAGQDETARSGILALANEYESAGSKGLATRLQELAASLRVGTGDQMLTVSHNAAEVMVAYQKAKAAPGSGGISTPFPELNDATKGARLGRFWIVAGYAKHGKTQLAKELVMHAARECGRRCLIVTREQTHRDMMNVLLVRHSHNFITGGIPFQSLIDGTLNKHQEAALRATIADAGAGGMGDIDCWCPPSGTTVADIRALIEHRSRAKPIDVVMVDHTILFDPVRRTGSKSGDIAQVIMDLKNLALDTNNGRGLLVIAPHQINRDGYEEALRRGYYIPSDMAETAEAERSADLMLWVLLTDELRDNREARIGIGFDRWGRGEPKGWEVLERYDTSALLPISTGTP